MACGYNDLSENLTLCGVQRAVKGLEPKIWVAPHSTFYPIAVNNKITDADFGLFDNFVQLSGVKDVFNTGSDGAASDFQATGYKHSLTIVCNVTSDEIDSFDDVVVLVERRGDKTRPYELYGYKNGLYRSSDSKKANDNSSLRTIEFASRDGQEEDYECIIIDLPYATALQNVGTYYTLHGMAIANTSPVYILSDKTAIWKSDNGVKYTGTTIDQSWSGIDHMGFRLALTNGVENLKFGNSSKASGFSGKLNYNNGGILDIAHSYSTKLKIKSIEAKNILYIYAETMLSLESVECESATTVDITGCPLLDCARFKNAHILYLMSNSLNSNSLNQIITDAYNTGLSNGYIDTTGGTNAWHSSLSDIVTTVYLPALISKGWTIYLNS